MECSFFFQYNNSSPDFYTLYCNKNNVVCLPTSNTVQDNDHVILVE